jgi:thiol-disulfide isomerase/thioredoxin
MTNSKFLGVLLLAAIPFLSAHAVPSESPTIPESHRVLTTPGASWLNTSRAIQANDFKNRIVLIDFWTYCCINCIHTLPDLAKLEKEFKDDLLVIGVHSGKFDNEKDSENIRQAIIRYGIEHPVVNDADFRIWQGFGVRSWPTLVLLNPQGEMVQFLAGEGHYEALKKSIQTLIKTLPKNAAKDRPVIPIAYEKNKQPPMEFKFPAKLVYVPELKTLFVADSNHQQIAALEWDPKKPNTAKVAYRIGVKDEKGSRDGDYARAQFNLPQGIAYANKALYIADTDNHLIRKVDLTTKQVTTIAGTGKKGEVRVAKQASATKTAIASPWDVAFFPDTDNLVIAMAGTHQLWNLNLPTQKLDVLAGNGSESIDDGQYPNNSLSQPSGLSPYLGGLYIADSETSSLRTIDHNDVLTTLIGTGLFDFGFKDGKKSSARMQHPLAVTSDITGIYIADTYNHSIRRYSVLGKKLDTIIGNGKRGQPLNEPAGIAKFGDLLIISDTNNHLIKTYDLISKKIETIKIVKELETRKYQERLPAVIAIEKPLLSPGVSTVEISLPSSYKLNQEAPSWLALFEGKGKNSKLIAEWDRSELIKMSKFKFPSLKEGGNYWLQGTFYYCQDQTSSLCEIASIQTHIEVKAASPSALTIKVSR